MKTTAVAILLLAVLAAGPATAGNTASVPDGRVAGVRVSDEWLGHHDGTFEGGGSWMSVGIAPEYYGAWAEGFDIGSVARDVTGVRIYVATLPGWYVGQPVDVYVWEGGVSTLPGAVLAVEVNLPLQSVPIWPTVGVNDFAISAAGVSGEIAVGFWVDSAEHHAFYTLFDEDGPGGYPWTNFAPDSGYPQGWGHPKAVMSWADCRSLGIELQLEGSSAGIEDDSEDSRSPIPDTWSSIKALFR